MRQAPVLKRILLAGSLIGAAVALSACGYNRGDSSLKTPVVSTHGIHRDIYFGPDHQILPEQAEALHAFLAGLRLDYGTRVMMEDNPSEGAPLRRAAIAAIVAQHGTVLSDNTLPFRTGMPAGTARLWIERARVTPPACPDWSSNPSGNMNASTHTNYGCATNSNLARMVADPADLTKGRTYDGASGTDIAKDQDYWRQRVPTGFEKALEKASTTTSSGGGGN